MSVEIVSKSNPLLHYAWGNNCDGWNLAESGSLSVKLEKMPGGTGEKLHFHENAQQFFFILKGVATFEIDGKVIAVKEQEGLHISCGVKHRIINNMNEDLEFILASQPSTQNDRINLE